MPNIVLPDIANSTKPTQALLDSANDAVVQVIGGQVGGTRYSPGLARTNLVASPAFRNEQKKEPNSYFTLPLAIGSGYVSSPPGIHKHSCCGALAFDAELLALVASATGSDVAETAFITGDRIVVKQDSQVVVDVTYPDPNNAPSANAQARPYVFSFPSPFVIGAGRLISAEYFNAAGTLPARIVVVELLLKTAHRRP